METRSGRTALVWFRRDLRVGDHRALFRAAQENSRIIPVFVFDNAILHHPLTGSGRVQYMLESLAELDNSLRRRGAKLITRHGVPHSELGRLAHETGADRLYYHEDTDRLYGRERDAALQRNLPNIEVIAVPDNGIFDGTDSRSNWSKRWEARMAEPIVAPLGKIILPPNISTVGIPQIEDLGVAPSDQTMVTPGGEDWAIRRLNDYLRDGIRSYRAKVSRPWDCEEGGTSRLSAPLSFGCISLRTVVQASLAEQTNYPESEDRRFWHSRLYWHDHFTQKLRDWHRAQYETINPVYNEIRQTLSDDRFQAWTNGLTGYPLIDASMRSLRRTGFLNFRMRAMVATYWSYDLWQPWQTGAEWFQKQLIDFDTGINHLQWQMQAGNVGWHANRYYNASEQAYNFDPFGLFIARWVPELAGVPMPQRVEPWKLSLDEQNRHQVRIGNDYPAPITDRALSVAFARSEFKRLAPAAKAWLLTDEARQRTSSERWASRLDTDDTKATETVAKKSQRRPANKAQLTLEL